jgi:hypothetical protein
MVTIEQPCYTLINLPSDSDPPNEMQLKMDLGMLLFLYCSVGVTVLTITCCNYISIYVGFLKTATYISSFCYLYMFYLNFRVP